MKLSQRDISNDLLIAGWIGLIAISAGGFFIITYEEPCRCGVSRIRADQRSLATGIEAYYVDHGEYPAMHALRDFSREPNKLKKAGGWNLSTLETGSGEIDGLTTPVAYVTSLFADPYADERGLPFAYYTVKNEEADTAGWILFSPGPDGDYDIVDPTDAYTVDVSQPSAHLLANYTYDPTNGTISNGDVWRVRQ